MLFYCVSKKSFRLWQFYLHLYPSLYPLLFCLVFVNLLHHFGTIYFGFSMTVWFSFWMLFTHLMMHLSFSYNQLKNLKVDQKLVEKSNLDLANMLCFTCSCHVEICQSKHDPLTNGLLLRWPVLTRPDKIKNPNPF